MCRKFMPKVMVGQYEHQLRQFTTTLSDYRGKKHYPKTWPANLSSYEIVIEALVLQFASDQDRLLFFLCFFTILKSH